MSNRSESWIQSITQQLPNCDLIDAIVQNLEDIFHLSETIDYLAEEDILRVFRSPSCDVSWIQELQRIRLKLLAIAVEQLEL